MGHTREEADELGHDGRRGGHEDDHDGRPKYEVNLDGEIHEWPRSTITVAEIRKLAGWSADQEVVMVDLKTNDETTLAEDAKIELKPGHGFTKKYKFKRGAR